MYILGQPIKQLTSVYSSGLMPEVDYAILTEFYQWILDNEQTSVDYIGKTFCTTVHVVNIHVHYYYIFLYRKHKISFLCPPLKKEGHIALHMTVGRYVGRSVGMSVALNLVQLITQECFAPETSNLVGR